MDAHYIRPDSSFRGAINCAPIERATDRTSSEALPARWIRSENRVPPYRCAASHSAYR